VKFFKCEQNFPKFWRLHVYSSKFRQTETLDIHLAKLMNSHSVSGNYAQKYNTVLCNHECTRFIVA